MSLVGISLQLDTKSEFIPKGTFTWVRINIVNSNQNLQEFKPDCQKQCTHITDPLKLPWQHFPGRPPIC